MQSSPLPYRLLFVLAAALGLALGTAGLYVAMSSQPAPTCPPSSTQP